MRAALLIALCVVPLASALSVAPAPLPTPIDVATHAESGADPVDAQPFAWGRDPAGFPSTLVRPMNSPAGPGDTRDFVWVCPTPPEGFIVPPLPTQDDPVVYGCPLRVYDTSWILGGAEIVLEPDDHNNVGFFALHGPTMEDGPHDHSRTGRTHTLFASSDQGIDWVDSPIQTTQKPRADALGSDGDIVLDSEGNAYLGLLYDIMDGSGYRDSVLQLVKAPRMDRISGQNVGYYGFDQVFFAREIYNTIDRIDLVHIPSHVPLREVEVNETAEPSDDEDNGEQAYAPDYANATEERVAAVWHETAFDWRNSTTGMSAWISAAWTDIGSNPDWDILAKDQLIGPCKEASNAVYWEAKIYVACVVEAGYSDRRDARIGDIDIWTIDVYTGNATLHAETPITGGSPFMAVNENGYMGLLTYSKLYGQDGNLSRIATQQAMSWYGDQWSRVPYDLGLELRRWGGLDTPLIDADITAYVMATDEPTAYIVYKEFHDDPTEISEEDLDPDNPLQPIEKRLTDYQKFFLSFNECDGPIAGARMELGTAVDQYNAQEYANNGPHVYNDRRDGLHVTRDANGNEVIYFAIGDYGAIQYGAVTQGSSSAFCNPLVLPPVIPAAAAPAALGLTSTASAAVGAAFGIPAVAMLGYLLTVKRRSPSYVTAEDQ